MAPKRLWPLAGKSLPTSTATSRWDWSPEGLRESLGPLQTMLKVHVGAESTPDVHSRHELQGCAGKAESELGVVLWLLAAAAHHQVLQVLAAQLGLLLPQQRQHLLGWQASPLQASGEIAVTVIEPPTWRYTTRLTR